MPTIQLGVANTYTIKIDSSPVYECALAIAAYTRREIYGKLAWDVDALHAIHDHMSESLAREVALASETHIWRSLLYLAHACPVLTDQPAERHVNQFLQWLQAQDANLRTLAAPHLGSAYADARQRALSGDAVAQAQLLTAFQDNPVVHHNLQYLFTISASELKQHLTALLSGWYREVMTDPAATIQALEADRDAKRHLAQTLTPGQLIATATQGLELQPEPGIHTLWLIPHIAYRPFTIQNMLPGCSIYYYPLAAEFLPGGDDTATVAEIAALHKALGDANRIHLLAHLQHGSMTLAELSDRVGTTKSTTHHHLTILRAAGFVQVHAGSYSLSPGAIRTVGDELRRFIHHD